MSAALEPTGAVITGGASGIGLAVAKELGARGTRLVLADLPGERLDAAVAALVAAERVRSPALIVIGEVAAREDVELRKLALEGVK